MPLTFTDIQQMTPEEIAAQASPGEVQALLQQLHGSSSRAYDPNASFADNTATMARNLIPSGMNFLSDTARAITSPIETAEAAYEAGPSGILSALGERFGNLPKTFVEDPVGLALDLSPGTQALGMGAKAGGMARLGGLMGKANPIGASARAGVAAGRGAGAATRSVLSAATGIDPGVITTARRALGATDASLDAAPGTARRLREGFSVGTSGEGPQLLQESISQVNAGISQRLNQIAEEGQRRFADVEVNPASLDRSLEGLDPRLGKRGVSMDLSDEGVDLDFTESVIPRKKGAQRRVSEAVDYAFEPLSKENLTIADVWLARRRIDEMRGRAASKGRNAEAGLIKEVRANVDEFLSSLDNPDFQKFNSEYAAGAALREHFEQLVSGKIDPDNQVASLVRSIRSGRQLSEDFITQVEQMTNVPLRAIAAGTEFSDLLPRGLIGRQALLGAPIAAATIAPEFVAGMFLTPPKFVGQYLRMAGVGERAVRHAGHVIDQFVSLPKVAALAEQGLTLGAIVNQLEREQNPRRSLMERIGALNR